MKSTKRLPRGIRNNNPLNIRVGSSWQGEVENPTDMQFEQFKEMRWGCRAAFKLLKRYIERYGCNTIEKIIRRWAPSSENDTERYINVVCNRMGIKRDEPIRFNYQYTMCILVQAMAYVENGQNIKFEDILEGYNLAQV